MYEIETEDFYKDISSDVKDKFETSNIPTEHKSGICNMKVIGMFKDEAGGDIIEEVVGLKAKLYSYKMLTGEESKKCKGFKKSVFKKSIAHEDYKKCLFSKKEQLRKMNVIRRYKHEVFTEKINEIALRVEDYRRIVQEDGMHTSGTF